MKRFSDAVKDGDNIWALIRGTGISQEGLSTSIGTPTVNGETLAMKTALKDAGIGPEEVSYVEAHGTGTVVGDPVEIAAIAKAYHSPKRTKPLIIGSVKTNVGHTESCSGIAGIMKVVLSMKHEIIPAHQNFTKLNPAINLDAVPAVIPLERLEWKRNGDNGNPRIAGVSSFGITGTDAHMIIQENPYIPTNNILTLNNHIHRPLHLLKLSAKTKDALETLLDEYNQHFKHSQNSVADIAYSVNTGRADFNHRAVILANSNEGASLCIEKKSYLADEINPAENIDKICFLFTGQGSQYPGMAKVLYSCSPVFQIHFEHCQKILKHCYNISIKDVLWSENCGNEINRTIYSQTSIFCVEYALLKLWASWGVKPHFVLGHSLGEFAAAVCAGILSLEDANQLIAERSKLIDQLPMGKMLVVQADIDLVQAKIKEYAGNDEQNVLDIAAINSSSQIVVAGDEDVVTNFSNFCTELKLKNVMLSSSHAFHSKHMDPILNDYRKVAKNVKIGKTSGECKFISGMRGDIVEAEKIDSEYWVEHTREKVKFLEASKKAVELGCQIFVEIGPHPVLSALTMMNNETILSCLPSVQRNKDDWETILTSLGRLYLKGVEIDWNGFDRFYSRQKIHSLPHYPFKGKRCWPEMMKCDSSLIHPLIGSCLENASHVKIFKNGINLEAHNYIKDHTIGQTVVIPGAGFLEMCLAAGQATVENSSVALGQPKRPMKVENLMIKAPLAFEDGKTCQVQTVVETNTLTDNRHDWNDLTVKIFHRQEEPNSQLDIDWLEHAVATFSPLPTAEEQLTEFDSTQFLEMIGQPSDPEFMTQFYNKLSCIGLNFGPIFQSLETIWTGNDGTSLLAKVKVPEGYNQKTGDYIVHPVVLDAMIQAIMVLKVMKTGSKMKLYVPIKVGKFVWMSSPHSTTSPLFIHVFENSASKKGIGYSTSSNATALLIDSVGKVLGIMTNVELIDTTVKAIESVLEQQTCTMPDLWEEIWHPQIGPSQYQHDLSLCRKEKFYDDQFINKAILKFNQFGTTQKKVFTGLERLVYLNFVRCLYDCGWMPELNKNFNIKLLIDKLEIKPEFSKVLNYMLTILSEEGILENLEPDTWKIIALPPTAIELDKELSSSSPSKFTDDLVHDFKSTLLFSKLGKNYSEILRGNQSALSILFPGDNDDTTSKTCWPSLADYYVEYGNLFGVKDMYCEITRSQLTHCKRHSSDANKDILRILEIGAGTGVFTEAYMKIMKELNIKFEYTFTDISSAFFPAAEKKFEQYSKHVTFKKLNIEEDPISQGFIPNYYDYVIATEVIHATKDLKESLENVGMLLRPEGLLVLAEQTRKSKINTFLVGLLDGFWRFQDKSIRPDHCTISVEKWKETLESYGFNMLKAFPLLESYHSLIFAVKSVDHRHHCIPDSNLTQFTKYWLYFHQEDHQSSRILLDRLSQLANRQVIIVTRGEKFINSKTNTSWNFTVRADQEQDFIKLMDSLEICCNSKNLEGIIYAWSLDTCATTQTSMLQPYFYMVKSLLSREMSIKTKLISFVTGIMPIDGRNNFTNFHSSTILGFTKSLKNERPDILCKWVDVGICENPMEMDHLFFELWNTDANTQVAYVSSSEDKTRYLSKLHTHKAKLSPLKLPSGTDRYQLILPETNSFEDLTFTALQPFILKDNEVEVEIKATALNFRDVCSVLKPVGYHEDANIVGFDIAGIVKRVGSKVTKWSVGDSVVGVNVIGIPLPSHVNIDEMDLNKVPEGMSFCEACTLPAVFQTSYYCLIDLAKITAADKVLIHTASGGVGLSAIQICKNIGATIFATAGSQRKRNYLKSLGIHHVFNSRDTKFGDKILEVTNGQGVDVVLNSLTSSGFKEATLKACAKKAHFIEMSKLSIWQPEDVKKIRPDVQYTIFDLISMEKGEVRRLGDAVGDLLKAKVVKPIPYVRFDTVNIREALEYLGKAKHIGKVVIAMSEVRMRDGKVEIYTPIFNENGTYLITGGLGGIGWAVCKWMVEMGAKNVILAGRKPPSEQMRDSIETLKRKEAVNIVAVQLDVSNFHECEQLIQVKIGEMGFPPLKGIMHAAGVLQDSLIDSQTWEKFSSTFKSKVDGTLNFHQLTLKLDLERFVLFSSLAAIFGLPGQSNHSAGNSFEDAIAHYRHSIGLPATTINWGQWGQVGIATEVDLPGLKTLSTLQALSGLEYAMKSQRPHTSIFNVFSFTMFRKLAPNISNIVDDTLLEKGGRDKNSPSSNIDLQAEQFWKEYDSLKSISERGNILSNKLRGLLRKILKWDDTDDIEDNIKFQEMGVDSLMFVELKNTVQTLLGNRIIVNASALKDCNSINMLTDTLIKLIEGEPEAVEAEVPLTNEEINLLIREDCVLPENIYSKPGQVKTSIEEVSKILLTGCTGVLGPYILKELVNMPQIQEIICLIRPRKQVSAIGRLKSVLQDRDLFHQVDLSKVRCVTGYVAKSNLGMEASAWEELCENVDAVFHCAANVNHVEQYRKRTNENYNDVRAINIGGLKIILEFSCTGSKLKHVYNASSICTAVTVDEHGCVSENWPLKNSYDNFTNLAYPISKFVGEVLMKTAVLERGIPGKVFRFPVIMGDSASGRFVLEGNHYMWRFLFMLKSGMMPSITYPLPTLPVDICASASVKLFFHAEASDEIYNVVNMIPDMEQEFVDVAKKLGYNVDIVEYSEFCQKIREFTPEESPFVMFKDLYGSEDDIASIYNKSQVIQQYILDGGTNKEFLVSKKIATFLPQFFNEGHSSMELIYRDLLFAKMQGWFAKYKI